VSLLAYFFCGDGDFVVCSVIAMLFFPVSPDLNKNKTMELMEV